MKSINNYLICSHGLFKFDRHEKDSTVYAPLIKRERRDGEGFCLKYFSAADDDSAKLIYEVEYGTIFCK